MYHLLKKQDCIDVKFVAARQHTDLLDKALENLGISDVVSLFFERSSFLGSLYSELISNFYNFFSKEMPDLVVVQGDTATVFAAAFAAKLLSIKIAHVEAGLRTFLTQHPFPEELNRVLTADLADIHFAPTKYDEQNLLKQGVKKENIFVVGATFLDLLQNINLSTRYEDKYCGLLDKKKLGKKIFYFSMHRREGVVDEILQNIIHQLTAFFASRDSEDVYFIVIKHPNNFFAQLYDLFNQHQDKCLVLDFIDHEELIFLLKISDLVMTDSGGVFEESLCLGKPVLCLRIACERRYPDLVSFSKILEPGFDLFNMARELLNIEMDVKSLLNLFGNGQACQKIVNVLLSLCK